jgi:site-specific recombinase XerD
MTAPAQTIEPAHARRLLDRLTEPTKNLTDLRTNALVLLGWGSALKLSEVLALNVDQVLQDPTRAKLTPIRETGYLRADQTSAAGPFILSAHAREALARYLRELIDREWLTLPSEGPLFVTMKGGRTKGAVSRLRLGKRAAQLCFEQLQDRAGIRGAHYRYGDLRHDALTTFGRVAGSPTTIAQFGRIRDQRTAQRYARSQPASLATIAQLAQGSK